MEASRDGSENGTWLERLPEILLAASGGIVVVSTALVATAHINDHFGLNHVSGAWMALARRVNEGDLYPAFFDGVSFGGTRFMPLQIVLNAAVAHLTGEYLVSGKIVSYAGAITLAGVTYLLLRRISGSWPLALGLVGSLLVTLTGFDAVHGIRGDALPVVLQLLAVTLVVRGSAGSVTTAGLLSALAFLSKLSAVWAPITILLWLSLRPRRRLLPLFLGAFVVPSILLLILFNVVSDGRMAKNIFGLSGAGLRGPGVFLLETSQRFIELFEVGADAIWLLLPLALASLVFALLRRRLTIYHVAFVVAFGVLVIVLGDVGASGNHTLDLGVLACVLVADLWRQAAGNERLHVVRIIMVTTLVWGIATSYQLSLRGTTMDAARKLTGRGGPRYPAYPLKGIVRKSELILSEDPYISVSRGHDPVVLDAFMLLRLLRDHPDWESTLIARLHAHAFSKVVLMRPLDLSDSWWQTDHFGAPVISAVQRNYRLARSQDGYWVYVPRSAEGLDSSG
jgi:hypothetical protein